MQFTKSVSFHGVQLLGHLLLGLLQDFDKILGLAAVFGGEEGDGSPLGLSSSGTPDAVDIILRW